MWKSYCEIALKVLWRRKFFSFVSLFAISFTLMVLMVATTSLDNLLHPSGVEGVGVDLLHVESIHQRQQERGNNFWGGPGYKFLDRHVRTLKTPKAVSVYSMLHTGTSFRGSTRFRVQLKSSDEVYWQILNFQFTQGRPFNNEEADQGSKVAVINRNIASRFFGDQSAIGKDITVDGATYQVIGVVEDVPVMMKAAFAEVWVPLFALNSEGKLGKERGQLQAVIEPEKNADIALIQQELQGVLDRYEYPRPEAWNEIYVNAETRMQNTARDIQGREGHESSGVGRFQLALLVAALAFMLLPAVNLINLNVSRIMERACEIGVRKAFGASSRVLIGQFMFENMILTFL